MLSASIDELVLGYLDSIRDRYAPKSVGDPEAGSLYSLLLQQTNATVDRASGTLRVYNPDGSEHATYTAVLGDGGQILGFRIRE